MISGTEASWSPVTGGVLQWSVLGPVVLNILNDLDDGAEFSFSNFANDTKLGVTDDHATIQKDPNRLEKWADRNIMKFSKELCNT